jgi:hypothetical protein
LNASIAVRLERPDRDKHSIVFGPLVNYNEKLFVKLPLDFSEIRKMIYQNDESIK